MKKTGIREKLGQILRVPLGDGFSGFAQVAGHETYAFFDLRVPETETPPLEVVVGRRVLFRIPVMKSAVSRGVWPVMGQIPPRKELLEPIWMFKQDPLSGALSISTDGGEGVPATRDQCEHLERAAVWDPEHVVSRLRDHFGGRPNKWVESMKLR